ncbi:MAG: hypothetical protein RL265_341, partial [Bacteroidota bacterium]
RNNAKYFDKNGWFYFTREIFDLLYPSYGDTYPTYNGAVGMTYEQGGSGRGGLGVLNNDGDTLTLTDRVQHHHIAGISTVEYATQQATKLIAEFQQFSTSKNYTYKSFVVGGNADHLAALRKLLDAHKIDYSFGNGGTDYSFGNGGTVKGFDYRKNAKGSMKTSENHLVISTNQVKGTLVNVLFEPKTKLVDSLTYDITAWSLPYAYGLDAIASETLVEGNAEKVSAVKNTILPGAYAYLADWNSMKDAQFLTALLQKGIRVRFAENAFVQQGKTYERGTLIVTRGDNTSNYDSELVNLANAMQIPITATATGLVESGSDFGASSVKLIKKQRIALLGGSATSSLNTGEIWHFFEKQLNYPITMVDLNDFSLSSLQNFDVLIVPEGWYSHFSEVETLDELKKWISAGVKLIAIGEAVSHFTSENGFGLKVKDEKVKDAETVDRHEHAHIKYSQQEREEIKNTITGAIFKCKIEASHPLAFGYSDTYFTLKLSANAYEWLEKGSNVVYLPENPELIAGFAGNEALKKQPKTLVFGQENMGNGAVIYMVDNPLFRGFWENGKLFFVNALFLTNN